MSKCPQCGYQGADREFKEFSKMWEIDAETKIRTGVSWNFSAFIAVSAAFAAGRHAGMEIVIAREGEFDYEGKLIVGAAGDIVITSSDDWQRKNDIEKNVLEWFGTWTEIRNRWS